MTEREGTATVTMMGVAHAAADGDACTSGGTGKSGGALAAGRMQPWVEKYRPKRVEDVSSQEDVIATLRKAMDTANVRRIKIDAVGESKRCRAPM